jgi:hypothetical protein
MMTQTPVKKQNKQKARLTTRFVKDRRVSVLERNHLFELLDGNKKTRRRRASFRGLWVNCSVVIKR